MANPELCNHCIAIDFEYFRNPTADSIKKLNQGDVVYGEYPFRFDTSDQTAQRWRLGRLNRIEDSASSCPLCRAIIAALDFSGLRNRKSALFDDNPVAQAEVYWSATLKPPLNTNWDLPALVKESRLDDSIFNFDLRRLSLRWFNYDDSQCLDPGVIESTPFDVPHTWATMGECFQSLDAAYPMTRTDDLFNDEVVKPDQELYGGRKRPPLLDMGLPKRWLQQCLDHHGSSCGGNGSDGNPIMMPLFRLIDVKERCVVEITDADLTSLRYAALSYVWGATPQKLQLKRANKQTLMSPGALIGTTSNTIEDAITFASGMGLPYIWVDAVCILQDDNGDKAVQISNMGIIYKHALFTIVAGSGRDAEAGLPGVKLPRTAEQHEVLVKPATDTQPPIRLMSTLTPRREHWAHYADDLHWSSRGWTLQEKVLSKRVLTFTDQQLFWACRRGHWWEETFLETDLALTNWFSVQEREFVLDPLVVHSCAPEEAEGQVWYQLTRLARNYGERQLTIQGDAHDAFSAILQECGMFVRETFLWGLPASARFELGLCWEPHRQGITRRTDETTLATTSLNRKVPFPSWSWLGWKGSALLRVEDKYTNEGIEPQILCYVLRNTPLRLVRVARAAFDNPKTALKSNFPMPNGMPLSPLAVTLDRIYANCPGLTPDRLADTPDDQLIFFWTEVSFFTLSGPLRRVVRTPQQGYAIEEYEVLDADGEVVGMTAHCTTSNIVGTKVTTGVEFMVLADNRAIEHPPQKIVLQIERRDGVVYRVNIAEIREDAWNKSSPTRELVAMG